MKSATLQIAFLTGRSNRSCWGLSPAQEYFLRRLDKSGRHLVDSNFPYEPRKHSWSPTNLVVASLNNIRDYAASRFPAFRDRYSNSVIDLVDNAPHTIFLAGSCGLELLNNLELPQTLHPRISIFAYGPVARKRPAFPHLAIQGARDKISRGWFREVDAVVNSGHMDYLDCPEVSELCAKYILKVEARLAARQVIS